MALADSDNSRTAAGGGREQPAPPRRRASRARTLKTCAGLVAAVWAIYAQTLWFPFVNFDDDVHVYENPFVVSGLTRQNLAWDWGIHGPSQWHPLAWLTHQVDCELYDLLPGGHHATNVALHSVAAILLFLALQKMTGSRGIAAFTAAAFAVHPLNVESVAWVAERRNVLCAVFSLLTILAYLNYVQRPSLPRYALCLAAHAAALMSKPLAVTIPCVLLLLDYWPLGRFAAAQPAPSGPGDDHPTGFGRASRWSIVLEKVPLLVLSAASSVLSVLCQQTIGTVASLDRLPLPVRIVNAVASYGWYLQELIWPSDLAVFYPHPGIMEKDPWPQLIVPAAVSAVVLLTITCLAVRFRRRFPWLLVGWLWYLGMMVPMIGIVQSGEQQRADRYAYLPLVGIFLAIACAGELLARRSRRASYQVQWIAMLVVCGWGLVAYWQTAVWHSSVELFTHTLEVVPRNHWAEHNLGHALLRQRQLPEAADHFRAATEIAPDYALAHYNLGVTLHDLGQRSAARAELETAIALDPKNADARQRLGAVLIEMGLPVDAVSQLREAVRLAPDDPQALFNLGVALAKSGQAAEGVEYLERSRTLKPDWAPVLEALRTIRNSP